MYERLLEKSSPPTSEQIREHLGQCSYNRLVKMEEYLKSMYQLSKEIKSPFGNSYGWGYKYSHKSSHLCYVFFEKDAFTVTMQIGDAQVPALETVLDSLSHKAIYFWENRYPCGERGGWIHYRILDDCELEDIYTLIKIKKKPINTASV